MASITKYENWNRAQLSGGTDDTDTQAARVIDWDTDTIKVMLTTSTYSPSAANHMNKDDVTNEVTGTNYTAGGETIGSISVSETGGVTTVDGLDVTWSQHASGFNNARYAVIYKDSGTAATSCLIGYIDFTTDKSNQTGDLTIEWNSSGIFTQT